MSESTMATKLSPAEPVVIVGSGLGGITVARELRKLNSDIAITLVTADEGFFYSKPNLSNAIAAGKLPAQLVATQREALAAQLKLTIAPFTRVLAINATENRLETSAGDLCWSKLVLAVGAQPIRLPIQGDAAGDMLSVNNLTDYTVFREQLSRAKTVALLGAGLIGCEFANDLIIGGHQVDVFDLAPQPLGRLLPPLVATFFQQRMEAVGVRFHFASSLARVDKTDSELRLTDQLGKTYSSNLVLSAVGLKAEIQLAQSAGLKTNRGIATDRRLESSAAGIYAVGDCAEVQGLNLPFVMPLMQQARALAKTLSGAPTDVVYPAMPVVVKTPACPTVVCPPPLGQTGEWIEEKTANGIRALFKTAHGQMLGFALVGDTTGEKTALAAQLPAWL